MVTTEPGDLQDLVMHSVFFDGPFRLRQCIPSKHWYLFTKAQGV